MSPRITASRSALLPTGSTSLPILLLWQVMLLALPPAAQAITCIWNGSAGNWDTDNNWSTREPLYYDYAYINSGVVTVNQTGETAGELHLSGALNVESGDLTVDWINNSAYHIESTGVLSVNGGTVTMGGQYASGSHVYGTLTVNGGKFVNTDTTGVDARGGHINITGGWLQSLNGPLLQTYDSSTHITLAQSAGGLEIASFTASPTNIASRFTWTGGRLRLTQTDLVIANSGILGPSLTLGPTHMLVVDQTLSITGSCIINANEAMLDANLLRIEGGTLKNPQIIFDSDRETHLMFYQFGSDSQLIRDQAGATHITGGYSMQYGQAHINAGEVHINQLVNIVNGHFYHDSANGHSTLESTSIGGGATAIGSFNMSNGTVDITVGAGIPGKALDVGGNGQGTFNHSNGTVNIFNGSITLAENAGQGIYNLSGGTLDMHDNHIVFGNGDPQFNFTGGTLRNVGRFDDIGVMRPVVFSGSAHLVRDQAGLTDFYGARLLATGNTRIDLSAGSIKSEFFPVLLTGRTCLEQTGGAASFFGGLSLGESGYSSPDVQYLMHAGFLDVGSMFGMRVGYEGTGQFTQFDGQVNVDSSEGLSIGGNGGFGVYQLKGGLLDMHTGAIRVENGLFHFTGGTLKNVNDFYGDLDQQGGTLIIGGSIGVMFIYGNYELDADAILEIELAGDSNVVWQDRDTCYVDGAAVLEGLLHLSTTGGYMPDFGDYFDVMRAETIDITGMTLDGVPNLQAEVFSIAGGQQVLRLTFIPEPAGAMLWLSVMLFLSVRRHAGFR